jgi:hypothetical protein
LPSDFAYSCAGTMISSKKIEHLSLSKVLSNRRWLKRLYPFPHVVAREVFVAAAYQELEAAFQKIFAGGLSNQAGADQFAPCESGYDAYSLGFTPQLSGPLRIFLSPSWVELLARLTDTTHTGEVNGGLHYHKVGSRNGKVHNDLNPGWFAECRQTDGVSVSQPS